MSFRTEIYVRWCPSRTRPSTTLRAFAMPREGRAVFDQPDQLQPQLQPQPQLGSFALGFDLLGKIRQASTKRGLVSGSSPSRGCVSLNASMILVCSRRCRFAASGSDAESSLSKPGIGACFPFGWLPLGCGSKLQTSAFVNF